MRDLPAPDESAIWFLANVVGLPGAIVTFAAIAMWAASWWSAVRATGRAGSAVLSMSSAFIRTRLSVAVRYLAATVLAQTGLVSTTYVLGQLFQYFQLAKDGQGQSVARGGGPDFDLGELLRSALAYDHWTNVSQGVVTYALVFVLLVDLLCVTRSGLETYLGYLASIRRWI